MKYTVLFIVALLISLPARADYFVWEDAETGVSFSYPDSWRQVSNYTPDDVVTIMAPGDDAAMCRIRAREDRRWLVYPQRFRAAIQREAYSEEFWNNYLASYDDILIYSMTDGAGLGEAFASIVTASYVTNYPMKNLYKTSFAAAGLYGENVFIFDCSSKSEAFNTYLPAFKSIMRTVSFNQVYHELVEGENNDMDTGPIIIIRDPTNRYTHRY